MTADPVGHELPNVELVSESKEELRFRVTDPEIYGSRKPYELIFLDPERFGGPNAFEDVYLRVVDPVANSAIQTTGKKTYEFASREVVPTEGRPAQVQVLAPGETRLVHAAYAWTVVARVIAREVRVRPAVAE